MENNDNKEKLLLLRKRSMQAVLSDGYRLYLQNLWRLVRSSWVQAVVYALTVGASMTLFFCHLLPRFVADRPFTGQLGWWALSLLLAAVAAILLAFAGGFAPLAEHAATAAIHGPHRWWGRWPWRLTARGLLRLPRMLLTVVRRHQLGTLIVVLLVMALLVFVATLLLQMPAVIMATAHVQAAADMAAGDTPLMPGNTTLVTFATFALCALLQAYIHLSTLFPLYYVWGNAQAGADKQAPSQTSSPTSPSTSEH